MLNVTQLETMKLKLFTKEKEKSCNELLEDGYYAFKCRKIISVSFLCLLFLVSCLAVLGIIQFLTIQFRVWQHVVRHAETGVASDDRVVSCYYNTPNIEDKRQLLPSNLHPHLCTHVNVAFAQIKNKTIYLDDHQYKSLREVVSLKKFNPQLKVLLSVGGASIDSGFPEMVADHSSRKVFIRSIKSVLRNHSLDGIDLDWEFPAIHDYGTGFGKRERQHFSQLLREIRMEYIREKRNYLLTVALAAPQMLVEAAYDVDQINMYVDYANIMTYDFHFFNQFTPFTGLNSPLFARSMEHLYMATLNVNFTVHMYMQKGLDKNKIVVGIPTYGHSFNLINPNNGNVGSPAKGFGHLGHKGFVNYPDICSFLNTFKNDVKINFDPDSRVPYLHKDHDWVSYDNPQSVMDKAKYIMTMNLRGAMIYSLNADDYEGVCEQLSGRTRFPLAVSIKNALNGANTSTP